MNVKQIKDSLHCTVTITVNAIMFPIRKRLYEDEHHYMNIVKINVPLLVLTNRELSL